MRRRGWIRRFSLATGLTLCACHWSWADDWSRFRGPDGTGISQETVAFPTKWSPNANIAWKLDLPGSGVSSPIVVGSKVFVTCYSGYGLSRENPGDIKDLVRHLVCVDLESGKTLWQKDFPNTAKEDLYTGAGVPAHGYASHTPVSDGKHVYAFFGKGGVYAFDLDGNQKWQAEVGAESDPWAWGSSASPVLHDGLLIVVAAAESQAIIGFDAATGKEVWRQEASALDGTWGTPTFVTVEGTKEMVLGVPKEIWGLDPSTGKLRWFAEVNAAEQANSSVIINDGVAFSFTGRGGGSAAVKVGGKGAVTESNVVWKGRDTDRFGSPIMYNGKLYLFAGGMLNVIDPETGERSSQERLEGVARRGGGMMGSLDYASPIIADGHMYYINGAGQMFVFSLGEEPRQLTANLVTNERETFGGTPAASQGRILFRSDKRLYCVQDMGQTVNDADNAVEQAPADEAGPGGRPGGGGPGAGGRGRPGGGPPGGPGAGGAGRPGGGGPGGRGGFGGNREDNRPKRPQRPTSDQ